MTAVIIIKSIDKFELKAVLDEIKKTLDGSCSSWEIIDNGN